MEGVYMNQKLHTARSGIVILIALLCIVCLSLSLALSAHFAAYAVEGDSADNAWPNNDGTNDLWLVYYEGCESGESLWDGIHGGKPISYIDSVTDENGEYVVREGTEDETNLYAPYRGIELTLKLNPKYKYNGTALDELYDLENAVYFNNSQSGGSDKSTDMLTRVEADSLSEGTEALSLSKTWKIATLCNTVDVTGTYIGNRAYGEPANYSLLHSVLEGIVVYDLRDLAYQTSITVAIRYENGNPNYYEAGRGADGRYSLTRDDEGNLVPWNGAEREEAAAVNSELINYLIRSRNALVKTEDTGAYVLTVTAMDVPAESGEIYYTQSSVNYPFDVSKQNLGDNDGSTFNGMFTYKIGDPSVDYTLGDEWLSKIGLQMWLGTNDDNTQNIKLVEGKDYSLSVEEKKVGYVNLVITGLGNITGSHTISGEVIISPATNRWLTTPNIITWTYGTYNAEHNRIVGEPIFLDNPEDVKFRIVRLEKDKNDNIIIKEIEELSDIHYYVYTNSEGKLATDWLVNDQVQLALRNLPVGNYRLYASVYGASNTDGTPTRNYLALEEQSVDFSVFKGANHWKAGSVPYINGGWTTGKLESTDGLMNAESEFGTPTLMIYDINDNLIYSNKPEHANSEFGNIDVLKELKAGRYYLNAFVEGTANYDELSATVLFDVVPNNLPIWAVILIVAGSLGLVALVFCILHQKGILQMLTGKVIVSMRTRANVDATLAAIRAAKVAREAQESVAAAKAREAEEAAKADKSEDK